MHRLEDTESGELEWCTTSQGIPGDNRRAGIGKGGFSHIASEGSKATLTYPCPPSSDIDFRFRTPELWESKFVLF